ncbi:MAG: domain/diguanylate cyclase [Deltaproteobacteria bacterium]|nr:domain/diguanylate cyclase [Deltaproteobacteria bacterium]
MPPPNRPRNPALVARRHWAAFLAPPYLLALIFLRDRYPEGPAFLAAAAPGFLLFLSVFAWNFRKRQVEGRLPDRESILVWAGVAALEIHVIVPAVAKSRTVPAALFFLLGLLLPPYLAVPAALACAAWFPAMVRGQGLAAAEGWATFAMAAMACTAGAFVRRRVGRLPETRDPAREAIARGRAMVLTREDPPGESQKPGERVAEGAALLRREVELRDGVRRSLETVLPLTGASHAAYLLPSHAPGSAHLEGVFVSSGGRAPVEFIVPESYLPVREATVFRRPFFSEGQDAGRYGPALTGHGIRPTGVAAVPVLREGEPEGVLLAVREGEGRWEGPVIPLMELVAFFVGREIERVRALHRGERHLLREDWYHRMVRKMAEVRLPGAEEGDEDIRTRRERVYAEAASQVRIQVGAARVLLIASDEGGRKGLLVREETGRGGRGEEAAVPLGDSYVGWVIRTGTQRLFSGSQGSQRPQNVLPAGWQVQGERSFIVFPTGVPGGFRGAIVCTHAEERRFHREHADIVRDIAEVMQLGLSHVEHLEALTRRATTDGLTGLSNRKSFLARLAEDLARIDGRHPCAVVMLDIDHFKRINDSYGHPFGDEVLRRVAGILGKAVRKGDSTGRYGGEEFALYLHMTDPEHAREVAERCRRMIRQARFLHEGREVTVTASFGIACSPDHGAGAEELLKRADEALYMSKNRGRDRVTVYPGRVDTPPRTE